VEKRLFNIFDSLRTKIVTLYDGPGNFTYIDRRFTLLAFSLALYSPYTAAAPLFEALSDLEKGDGHKIYRIVEKFFWSLTVTCQDCNPSTVADGGASPDADTSIQCADSGPVSDDLTFVKSVYNSLAATTHMAEFGLYVALRCVYVVHLNPLLTLSSTCSGWSLESKTRFTGTIGGDTSFPLLFIGNTHGMSPFYEIGSPTKNSLIDNITPLHR
jgi:hypothetical protein